jgi:hypothetical protein
VHACDEETEDWHAEDQEVPARMSRAAARLPSGAAATATMLSWLETTMKASAARTYGRVLNRPGRLSNDRNQTPNWRAPTLGRRE